MKKKYVMPDCVVVKLNTERSLMQTSPVLNNNTATRQIINDAYSGGGSGYSRETISTPDAWEEW